MPQSHDAHDGKYKQRENPRDPREWQAESEYTLHFLYLLPAFDRAVLAPSQTHPGVQITWRSVRQIW